MSGTLVECMSNSDMEEKKLSNEVFFLCVCVQEYSCSVRSLSDFIKNTLICVLKMN